MSDHLPKEIVENILSRLCAKSVLQLRCVCKLWREVISDPGFIEMHYNRSKEKYNVNIFANILIKSSADTYFIDPSCGTLVDLAYLMMGRIAGCCNGLICTHDFYWGTPNVTLFNPSTRQHKTSIYPCFDSHDPWESSQGFGYDQTLNTYKLVELTSHRHLNAYVYTFSTNQWRLTHKSIPYHVPDRCITNTGVFVNGSLYWHANSVIHHPLQLGDHSFDCVKEEGVILSFDCVKEEFSDMPLPVTPRYSERKYSYLANFRGQLCDITIVDDSHVEVWVMEIGEPGSSSCWMKLVKFNTSCTLPSSPRRAWYSILPVPGPPNTLAGWLLKMELSNLTLLDQKGTRWSNTHSCSHVYACLDTLTSLDTLNWKIERKRNNVD